MHILYVYVYVRVYEYTYMYTQVKVDVAMPDGTAKAVAYEPTRGIGACVALRACVLRVRSVRVCVACVLRLRSTLACVRACCVCPYT